MWGIVAFKIKASPYYFYLLTWIAKQLKAKGFCRSHSENFEVFQSKELGRTANG